MKMLKKIKIIGLIWLLAIGIAYNFSSIPNLNSSNRSLINIKKALAGDPEVQLDEVVIVGKKPSGISYADWSYITSNLQTAHDADNDGDTDLINVYYGNKGISIGRELGSDQLSSREMSSMGFALAKDQISINYSSDVFYLSNAVRIECEICWFASDCECNTSLERLVYMGF